MLNGTEDWCNIWRKTDLCFQKWQRNLANFHRLKNNDFILESKMAELNQNKNLKQLDQPDVERKLLKIFFEKFYLRNKWIAQLAKLLTHVLQNRCS